MEKKGKGFTLIEIIICIALISLISIGSIIGFKTLENRKNDKFYKQFDNALEVYLSEHSEIYTNLSDNVEGAVITLEVLKNEGLISDNIIDPNTKTTIDYKNNYYVLSDAVLLVNEPPENENVCDGQVELNVLKSWETLNDKVDTSEIIYICPKDKNQIGGVEEEEIEDIKKRLESLENQLSTLNLGGDNWILFDVNTNKNAFAYWPEENQDLWAFVGINNAKKEIKLVYNNYVGVNNTEKIEYKSSIHCTSFFNALSLEGTKDVKEIDLSKSSLTRHYQNNSSFQGMIEYKGTLYHYISGDYYKNGKYDPYYCKTFGIENDQPFIYNTNFGPLTSISGSGGWSKKEIESERYNTSNSKKKALFDAIKSTSNIVTKKYYYNYNYYDTTYKTAPDLLDSNGYYEDKLGNINSVNDNIKNIRNSLIGLTFYMGSYQTGAPSPTMNGYVVYRNGEIGIEKINDITDGDSNDFYIDYSKYSDKKYYKVWASGGGSSYYKDVKTINYVPVITIKYNNLLTDINTYPDSYKTKYSSCTNDNLGNKDCPYIVKMADGTLSWS